ncbi:hypothetical protein CWI42_081260 [Ordospora colligata]|uniref:Uncharacterized protein n=1 Tax=Ordospora colligata OC4 TaxID=1354746 RepID=A0A0B2UK76_9MICR|nr:uncharacterized protein M896_081260 [Ordospora colligata OC4]KHN69390.1 hypothetical protein M896_081260 [Ordospora colligata OC4]TBU14904.1 hypothetical protein CWI41_081250 [Ordospora colligata]TBU15035.1 hypothetical protein CWI40_081270 [Ordospora colligata]TBU18289.1 hypothetical protein CWI42_081260 [Ordospora colligata]
MRIVVNDKKLFKAALKSLSCRKEITIDAMHNRMILSSHGFSHAQCRFYLSIDTLGSDIPSDLDHLVFTVNPFHLFEGILLLDEYDIVIDDSMKLTDLKSTIMIPFISTVVNEYEDMGLPVTKCVLTPKIASTLGMLRGIVVYEAINSKLLVKKSTCDGVDEIEICNTEFLMNGDLKFKCNNDWTDFLDAFEEHSESVMLTFSSSLLSVQFLLKNHTEGYLEIQVPRLIVDQIM